MIEQDVNRLHLFANGHVEPHLIFE